jgi:hypothetical protein
MEMEETLKQVDVADTKATDRDEEIKLIKAEYEHKVKLAENRALYREQKGESRSVMDARRELQITKDDLESKLRDKEDDLEYYTKKCEKLDDENASLKINNKAKTEADNKIRELTQENYTL